jgi:hypothetical protein
MTKSLVQFLSTLLRDEINKLAEAYSHKVNSTFRQAELMKQMTQTYEGYGNS